MVRISDILKRDRDEGEFCRKKVEEIKEEEVSSISTEKIKEEKVPSYQPEITRTMTEKTKLGGSKSEQIYQELIDLIKDILNKGKKNESIQGKEIVLKIERAIDQMALGGEQLIALTNRSTLDDFFITHAVNVCLFSIKIGLGLGYNKPRLKELGISAFLWDIGTIKVMNISQHPHRLTKEGYQAIKEHPIFGVEILEKAENLTKTTIYVLHEQHKRVKGNEYLKGLKGEEVKEYARIVAVVDGYETLIHPRAHGKKLHSYEAMKEILKNKKQFEPRLIKALIEEIGIYPPGSWVALNSSEIGKVINTNRSFPLRPLVNVIFGSDGRKLDEIKTIDLARHPTLYVKKTLDDSELKTKLAGPKDQA